MLYQVFIPNFDHLVLALHMCLCVSQSVSQWTLNKLSVIARRIRRCHSSLLFVQRSHADPSLLNVMFLGCVSVLTSVYVQRDVLQGDVWQRDGGVDQRSVQTRRLPEAEQRVPDHQGPVLLDGGPRPS